MLGPLETNPFRRFSRRGIQAPQVPIKKGQGKSIHRLALSSILKQNTRVFRPPVLVVRIVSTSRAGTLKPKSARNASLANLADPSKKSGRLPEGSLPTFNRHGAVNHTPQ